MKNIFMLILVGILAFAAKHFYDTRYERALVGTWEISASFKESIARVEFDFEETYLKDGTASGDGKFLLYINDQYLASAVIRTDSTWKVEGDTLYETLTSLKMGKFRGVGKAADIFKEMRTEMKKQVGIESATEIVRIRGKEIRLKDEKGIVYVGSRK